jgi:hypothetical protein
MKNLQSFGVQELNAKESRETNGGNWWRALILAVAAAHDSTCDADSYGDCTWVNGVAEHYDSAPMWN